MDKELLNQPIDDLIETLYASALVPEGFDGLFSSFEAHILELVGSATGKQLTSEFLVTFEPSLRFEELLPKLDAHVSNARKIQVAIGHATPAGEEYAHGINALPLPSVVISARGAVIHANAAARMFAGKPLAKLADFVPDETIRGNILNSVADLLSGKQEFASIPIWSEGDESRNLSAVLRSMKDLTGQSENDRFVLSVIGFSFDANVEAGFRKVYDLSSAESAIALRIAAGRSPQDIAEERGVSLHTVRAQVKSIKAKTGVKDIPELVRLLCGFVVGLSRPAQEHSTSSEMPHRGVGVVILEGGRRMEWRWQGDPDGAPTVLFHNIPYGSCLPDAAAVAAAKRGIRLLAPLRAGYGLSDPSVASDAEDLLETSVHDTRALLDHLKLPKVDLIGTVGGATHAIRFAKRYPERVGRIILLGRGPIWRPEWLKTLTPRHRAFSILMKYTPAIARILAWSKLSYINRHDAKQFLIDGALNSPPDVAVANDALLMPLIAQDIRHALRDGIEIYCREWAIFELDLTSEAAALPQPIKVLHGTEDRIIPIQFSKRFCDNVPSAELLSVEGGGHFFLYSHWRAVVDQLVSERNDAPSSA